MSLAYFGCCHVPQTDSFETKTMLCYLFFLAGPNQLPVHLQQHPCGSKYPGTVNPHMLCVLMANPIKHKVHCHESKGWRSIPWLVPCSRTVWMKNVLLSPFLQKLLHWSDEEDPVDVSEAQNILYHEGSYGVMQRGPMWVPLSVPVILLSCRRTLAGSIFLPWTPPPKEDPGNSSQ